VDNADDLEAVAKEAEAKRHELEGQLTALKKETQELGRTLRIPMLLQDMRTQNEQIDAEIAEKRALVDSSNLTAEVCQEISHLYAQKESMVRKRKRLCLDIVGSMTENSDATQEQVFQHFGIA